MGSLKTLILLHLRERYPKYVHGGAIERLAMELQHKASNGGRRARELEKEGLIEKRYNDKHEVEYRAVPIDDIETDKSAWEAIIRINSAIHKIDLPPPFTIEKAAQNNQKELF